MNWRGLYRIGSMLIFHHQSTLSLLFLMSSKCKKWQDTDVWFRTESSEEWLAGTVVEAQENSGAWKFSVRPCEVGAAVVTLWPHNSGPQTHESSFLDFDSLKRRNLQEAELVHDLTKLHGVSDPEVERIVAERFFKHMFYTEVGPVLLYLNYWGDLKNDHSAGSTRVSPECPAAPPSLQEVFEAGERRLLHQVAPHPYKLAERVYRAMQLDACDVTRHENQTVILTGESGSGKTRNLQFLLEYLTYSSSKVAQQAGVLLAYDNEVEDLVLAANVIVSSFGCARTHAGNPASSRFGKHLELFYSDLGFLEGSQLRTFLLESGRVTHQAGHQRNFNVFGEIAAGLNPYEQDNFGFNISPEFRYLRSAEHAPCSAQAQAAEQERHSRNYGQLREAMTVVGMSALRQVETIKVLVGILHLGNIDFERVQSGSACTSSEEADDEELGQEQERAEREDGVTFAELSCGHVDFACKILGFTVADLCGALTTKTARVAGRVVVTQHDAQTSGRVRDTLARTLYHSLFQWLVVEINRSLGENLGETSAASIGILDIFGLDSTKDNRFDQMCQNYANELLQCHFFGAVLDGQTKEFSETAGRWVVSRDAAADADCRKHIDIFESDFCGIFPILNTVMQSASPSEEQFMALLRKSNSGNPLLEVDKKSSFTIRHYAYAVTYQVEGILEMNQGLREITFATLSTSSSGQDQRFSTDNSQGGARRLSAGAGGGAGGSPIRRRTSRGASLSPASPAPPPGSFASASYCRTPPPSDRSKYKKVKASVHKKQTIAHCFVTQVHELLTQVRATRSHFLQCIKTSLDDKPDVYEAGLVAQQLQYCACMRSIEAVQQDLSLSMPYSAFLAEYSLLLYVAGKGPLSAPVFRALEAARERPKQKAGLLRAAVLSLVEVVPVIGAVLGHLDRNPWFVKSDRHCYDGFAFSSQAVRFSAEHLDYLESLKRSTTDIIATRVQRVWKAHRLMRFKRYAHARGQHALVYVANTRFSGARAQHTSAVVLQRRARVFLAVTHRKRALAAAARQLQLHRAAVKVQAFARCQLVRRRYSTERTQGMAFAKLMTILGCEGDDLASELVLFRYQMDILRAGAKVAQAH